MILEAVWTIALIVWLGLAVWWVVWCVIDGISFIRGRRNK
jgi:hypothetical protein